MALLMDITTAEHSNAICYICRNRILRGHRQYIWDWGNCKAHAECEVAHPNAPFNKGRIHWEEKKESITLF